MTKRFFRRKANRLLVDIPGYGFIPLAEKEDDYPIFLTVPPKKGWR